MTVFARHIENELVYAKTISHHQFQTNFPSIVYLFRSDPLVKMHEYSNNSWLLNNDLIFKDNRISSSYATSKFVSHHFRGLPTPLDNLSLRISKPRVPKNKTSGEKFFKEIRSSGLVTLSPNNPHAAEAIHNIDSLAEFSKGWDLLSGSFNSLSVETTPIGDCLKIYILKGKVVAVHGIVPAFVRGDGKSNIERLIHKLQRERRNNIFYRNKNNTFNPKFEITRIPADNEIVPLQQHCDINQGAVLVELSHLLAPKFFSFAEKLTNTLTGANYIESTIFSSDFSAGPDAKDFLIRDIKLNTADVTALFSCATNAETVNRYLSFFQGSNQSADEQQSILMQSSNFNNKHLDSATQFSIMQEAADRKGLLIKFFGNEVFQISDKSREKSIGFVSGLSSMTSAFARDASNNKFITKQLLNRSNINTPKGFKASITDRDAAWDRASAFSLPLVIKPLSGSGGVGVTTDIIEKHDFDIAWQICEKLNTKTVLIEETATGNDYRIIVIGNKVCAVTQRIAAHVVGTGIHNIKQLIDMKAQHRLANPFYRLKHFQESETLVQYLRKLGITLEYIPDNGERVQLLSAVNIGSGGESIDRTDDIHPEWISIAVEARKAIFNPFHAGLDLMAQDITRPPHGQSWSILEVNTNPELGLQLFPGAGVARDVGVFLLNELFGETVPSKICYKFNFYGKVQKVGFRNWLQNICNRRCLVGVVKNAPDANLVEALIYGPESCLDDVLRLCYAGPKRAVVSSITIERRKATEGVRLTSFEIR